MWARVVSVTARGFSKQQQLAAARRIPTLPLSPFPNPGANPPQFPPLLFVAPRFRSMLAHPNPASIDPPCPPLRPMDNEDNGNHLDLAVPGAALTLARCGYVLVAAPVTSICAGLADTPGAALVTYSLLLLGVAFISLSVLLPRRPTERVLEEEENRAVLGGNLQGDDAVLPDAGTIAWCGYLLVAAPVLASWAGLADTPVAAVFAYALLLLGAAFVNLAMVLPRPVERVLEEENRGVGNGNHQASEVLLAAAAGTIAWSGYLLVAAPVLASWAGLVDGPVASFVVYALLLLGVAFIGYAMLAPAKPKIA